MSACGQASNLEPSSSGLGTGLHLPLSSVWIDHRRQLAQGGERGTRRCRKIIHQTRMTSRPSLELRRKFDRHLRIGEMRINVMVTKIKLNNALLDIVLMLCKPKDSGQMIKKTGIESKRPRVARNMKQDDIIHSAWGARRPER